MSRSLPRFLTVLFCLVLVSACAGTRNSYEQLIVEGSDPPTIQLQVGDEVEVLAIGDGFPGWWGYYPAMMSCDPNIAVIRCERQRSQIPFREPGVLFGGNVCRLYAQKTGETDLYTGSQFTLDPGICNEPGSEHSIEDRIHLRVVAAPVQ